jgi:amino acid adenylation domain-containing protein
MQAQRARDYPLSFAQERLWFLYRVEPHSSTYNMAFSARFSGPLNLHALQQSLAEIVRRHEALRATIIAQDRQPTLSTGDFRGSQVPILDISDLGENECESQAKRMATQYAHRPFELERGPVFRISILRFGADNHILMVCIHQVATDGRSMGVFGREMCELYDGYRKGHPATLPNLPIQYADFVVWQRGWLQGNVLQAKLDYWRQCLSDVPTLDLPVDRPRPLQANHPGAALPFRFSADLTHELEVLCRREGVTSFIALLSGFQTVLARYSGQDDFVVGTDVANRNRIETEGLIGFFVNQLALRVNAAGNQSFRDLLGRTRETTLGAYAHQDLPFERLVDELKPQRDLGCSPLFQVKIVIQNVPDRDFLLSGVDFRGLEINHDTAKFDLTISFTEDDDEIGGFVEYATDLFESTSIQRLLGHFRHVLEIMTADSQHRISETVLLSEFELQQVLVEHNDTWQDLGTRWCLHELIDMQADATPQALAVASDTCQLTYTALKERTQRLAIRLASLGVGPESLVAVCLERGLALIEGLLGVLKAGAAYVPMDPSYPEERLRFMIENSQAAVVLTQEALLGRLSNRTAKAICLDQEWESDARDCRTPKLVNAQNVAYMIYTSGSTGLPKGAMNAHEGIVNRVSWMQEAYNLVATDRVLQKTTVCFDVSVWELFWPLVAGAVLVMAESGMQGDAGYLSNLIAREQITTLHFVPAMLEGFLDQQGWKGCDTIRLVISSGEALPESVVKTFHSLGGVGLENLYGPTETAIDVTYHGCRGGEEYRTIPIGRPITNTRAMVVDQWGGLTSIGVPGELCIGGTAVGRGYWNQPGLTAERFIPDGLSGESATRLYRTGDKVRWLSNGELEYLERLDHQVKLRGYRIELGEIQSTLAEHPAIRHCLLSLHEGNNHIRRLVAYVVPVRDLPPADTELRAYLQAKLPEYMVPSAFVYLQEFPLTPNGKIDRKALPAPKWEGTALSSGAPESSTEKLLRDIWAQVLKAEQIGVNDNFFQLGGDSILSIQVVARANRAGLSLNPQQIFENPTIAELSRVADQSRAFLAGQGGMASHVPIISTSLENRTTGEYRPSDFPRIDISQDDLDDIVIRSGRKVIEDIYPLTPLQEGMVFHTLAAPRSGVYINQHRFTLQGDLDVIAFKAGYREVIRRHQILRTAFLLTSGGRMFQVVYRDARLSWGQYDWREEPLSVQQEETEDILREDRERGFDLSKAPLMRLILIRQDADIYIFYWSFHMLLVDGWSLQVLLKEALTVYDAVRTGGMVELGPPSPYADYIEWLQRQDYGEAEAYWRRTLAGVTSPAPLRSDRLAIGMADQQEDYGEKSIYLEVDETAILRSFATGHGLTVNTLMQGVWALLLSRWSNTEDVVFGSVVSGRPGDLPGVESTVGMFVNTVPVRVRIMPTLSLLPWLKALQSQQAEARRFEFCSVVDVRRWSGLRPGESLFETILVFQNIPTDEFLSEPSRRLRLVNSKSAERTNYPLTVEVRPGARWQVKVVYDNRRFDESTIDMKLDQIRGLLMGMTSDSEAPLGSLSTSTETERTQLIGAFNLSLEENLM